MRNAVVLTLALGLVGGAMAENTMRVKNLKVLVAIYRGEPDADNRMSDHDVTMAKNGLELGRLFYFRNSRARLNIEFDWWVIDRTAPENAGPTMDHIEADLRERGARDGEYDGVIATGVGFKGNWGGFSLLGGAGGCFGIGGKRGPGYPGFDPDVGYGWAWIFAHEFQHALDLVIVEDSGLKMLSSHPYADSTEEFFKGYYQGGEHWDWVALTLREFNDYLAIKGATNSFLECVDADGDGLPDDDPRLPADEKRFNSDPTTKDTDGDGLDDLGEFVANRYAGSDPRKADTDGDGLTDSEDQYPLVRIAPKLMYVKEGEDHAERLLDSVFARNDEGGDVVVFGAWNETGLRLQFVGPRAMTVQLKIDGSAANGFWEGGDTYLLRLKDGEVLFSGLGLSGPVPGATCRHVRTTNESDYLLDAFIPAALGQGVSKEINYGGKRDPADVASGLTLISGRSIGFNVIYDFADGTHAVLTPTHSMYATRLVKPADAPERPLLRGPTVTNEATPVVEVLGIAAQTRVHITRAGQSATAGHILGARIGPGPVHLVSLDGDGVYELHAVTDGGESNALTMTVDRTAAAPVLRMATQARATDAEDLGGFGVVTATCEPQAEFELWWGIDGVPVAPLAGAQADEKGEVRVPLTADFELGWVATAFDSATFTDKAYVEAWPKIDRNFEGGPPDPRLGGDYFSYRFEGYLPIEHAGRYLFELSSDDGSRLFIDDEIVLDNWGHHPMAPERATTYLDAGLHRVRVDYYEEYGWAGVHFRAGESVDGLTVDVPVHRAPLPISELELFGVQVDTLGNRSAFGPSLPLSR